MLADIGGDNTELYNINNSKIESLFEHIQVDLGIQVRNQFVGIHHQGNQVMMRRTQANPFL